MVGRQPSFNGAELWEEESPRSEIVIIAARDGFAPEESQQLFDG
jgi:hypothetical protein